VSATGGGLGQILARRRWARVSAEAGFDVLAWVTALLAVALVSRDIAAAQVSVAALWRPALAVCLVVPGGGLLAGLYRGRFQRGSLDEVAAVVVATATAALCLAVAAPSLVAGHLRPPQAPVLAAAVVAALTMLGGRYVAFAARLRCRPAAQSAVKIIVFGAGDAGAQLIRRLVTRPGAPYRPVAILDDDPDKRQLRIHGVPVLGDRTRMAEVAAQTGANVLVIALAGLSGQVIRDVTTAAEKCGLVPKVIPSIAELLRGSARIESVRDPRISDLLGRRPIETDLESIASYFAGKRVLVTGAGGSIGSELCRQLHRLGPDKLVLLDRDESALHALELTLYGHGLLLSGDTVLANIRDEFRMHEIFRQFRPHIVFHAAALKHLPLLERHPAEAVLTNVRGTQAVLEAAVAAGVRSFVNISTDKAANPISVLGYSKRIAERLTAQVAGDAGGAYLSVRFGNVLGSKGSVLTALSAQVAAGGPVTVTDPEVSRYFMTADEAVQLVLQAAVIGRGGEALVLDMGEPVRIAEIARRLAAASTQRVEIVFSGLRPGEKLMEDLLGHGEADHRPCHPLISQVPVPPLPPALLTELDPAVDAGTLRAALARCAAAPCPAGQEDPSAPAGTAGRPRVLSLVSPVPGPGAMAASGNGAESALVPFPPPSRALRWLREAGPRRRDTPCGASRPRGARPGACGITGNRWRPMGGVSLRGPSTARPGGPSAGRAARRPERSRAAGPRPGRAHRRRRRRRATTHAPGPRGRATATRAAARPAPGPRCAPPGG
jgi:FlaA1/EpsC-like NDP-sugar epimerase